MNPDQIVVACPCGGHSLTLPAMRLPIGARAAFTCPACGERRTGLRTEQGVVVDMAPHPAQPQSQPEPAAALPPPRPLPPGTAACALAADLDAAWLPALDAALPPGWQVLAGDDPAQTAADCSAHRPRLLLLGEGPAASAALAATNALPGRQREAVAVVSLYPGPDNDALAAFARSADAVLDARDPEARAERLRAALGRIAARPALFGSPEGH
jgi:hypothetical protein